MKRVYVAAAGFALVAVLALAVVYDWGARRFTGAGPLVQSRTVTIDRGADLETIAAILADAGVVSSPFIFQAGVRLSGNGSRLRAGEYAFPAAVSPKGAMQILMRGRPVQHGLTIAEGLTTEQALAQIRAVDFLSGEITVSPGEGELLPDTYYFERGDPVDGAIARMQGAMRATLDALWEARAPDLPYATKREALILASIIEKETSLDAERRRVAAVFVNRLRRGMRLQSDPTVIYGITKGDGPLGRALVSDDLEAPGPYNTYLIDRLPPGPIANPGRASIEAALNPLTTSELYFVADGSGGHVFATTIEEHNRNVAKWRKLRHRQRRGDASAN